MQIRKRDGRLVEFDGERIKNAIVKSMSETVKGIDNDLATGIAKKIEVLVSITRKLYSTEEIQDMIEENLMSSERKDVAKQYILYRESRSKNRKPSNYKLLDDDFISKYKHLPSNMSPLGEFVYYRTYSRYLKEEGRRETWLETCRRAIEYNCSLVPTTTKEEAQQLFHNMFNMKQFISGRTIWVGGTQVSKDYPMSNFNCAFQTIDEISSFVELLYLLLLGTGVGLRITKEDVEKLPKVRSNYRLVHQEYNPRKPETRNEYTNLEFFGNNAFITIGDSKNGWVDGLKYYLSIISENQYSKVDTIIFDYNSVRPNGEKLKTFGGTASGHGALKDIFIKIDRVIQRLNTNFRLRPIDCLDIANIIGEGVVVGGVRRTAEIVLFDSDDEECIQAKSNLYKEVEGQWIVDTSILHRQMSNNSIYYKEKPTREKLHWQIEKMRYSGEPAFVNEEAAMKRRPDFKGCNPCAEILLDSKGMCNLTTVNVMSFVDENNKLDIETLLQAQALSARAGYRMTCVELELPRWNIVQQRDKLVGCSLTGWQDMVNAIDLDKCGEAELLRSLRQVAKDTVNNYAKTLGQKKPLLVTTLKPEGTLSQLPVVSSGVHYSHSPYYIRRIRVNAKDPIIKVCEELGYPIKPENGQTAENCKTKVVSFPVKAPDGKTKYHVSAIEQLENYILFMDNYVDHNCSITVHVREHEWELVEQWLWDNWEKVVAVSFLSLDDNFYEQLPYEEITKEQYDEMVKLVPKFIPSLISKYEVEEQELEVSAPECVGGSCPVR